MATMRQLQAEYELIKTHRQLIDERSQLSGECTTGAAFVYHCYRTRAYMSALETYVAALAARRRELEQHTKRSAS